MSGQLKKIAVFTVTGAQGSSVAKALLRDGQYEVIGITRNPQSDKARELAKLGVKTVQGDLDDSASYTPHLEGIYGAYVNADFNSSVEASEVPKAIELEYTQTRDAIEAVVGAGVKHIVYSALEDSHGKVPYFESKAKVIKWAKGKNFPITYLFTSWYISNLTRGGGGFLQKDKDGEGYVLAFPTPDDTLLGLYAVEQTGEWVLAALNSLEKYNYQDIQAASEFLTIKQWADEIALATGKPTRTLGISKEVFDKREGDLQKIPEAMWGGYSWLAKGGLHRDVEASKTIVPDQWNTKAWIAHVGLPERLKF